VRLLPRASSPLLFLPRIRRQLGNTLRSGSGYNSGNFGLYTTIWDHLFSTMLPTTREHKIRD
jgi:hypothetical protein